MKFLRMMNHRIMNAAEELSGGGGADFSGDANDYSSTNIMGASDEQVFKDFGLDPEKYGIGRNDESEAPAEELDGTDETQKAGQATDEKSYLEWVNSLGAIHNDSPVKVESIEEVKNALQMFKDYTQKTQTLSEERKGWESEKSQTEKELNGAIEEFNNAQKAYGQQLQEMQQWTFALNQLKTEAPDIFEEVQRAYEGTVKQFSNPVLDSQLAAIRAELAETKKGLSQREDKLIVDQFETEKASMTATEQSLKELGVNIDWTEVKKQWASTGLPLKNVVGSIYFDHVAKAQASKSKVETTKQKVAAKPVGGAGASRPGTKAKAIDPKLKGLAYASALLDRYTT